MHSIVRDGYIPGVIVHIPKFPFAEEPRSNSRYGMVVARHGADITVRGIYTNRIPGSAPIPATRESGLRYDSFLSNRLVLVRPHQISHTIGGAPFDYDPFGDFTTNAA